MKKLISLITAALTAFSATSLITSAESAPDLSDDNIMHESHTRIVGDLNNDGEITISDLVTMSNVLLRKGYDDDIMYYRDELGYTDLNFDLETDVFDLVEMRKLVISPETAFKQINNVDILASAEKSDTKGAFISFPDEISTYLSLLGTDAEEIQKYVDMYDEDFFRDNDLVFCTLMQEYGNGIHFKYPESTFLFGDLLYITQQEAFAEYFGVELTPEMIENLNFFCLITSKKYISHPMVYPEKKQVILFHTNVPKQYKAVSGGLCGVLDFELFVPDYDAHKYYSEDGKNGIMITVNEDHFMDDSCIYEIYRINDDGSYTYIDGYTDAADYDQYKDGYKILHDDIGNIIYYFNENCYICFYKENATITYVQYEYDERFGDYRRKWKNIFVFFDDTAKP
ncbi:hypothetical protein [Ruminococcus flavefaciens]|uniref:Dockerin domain-containing protein n=1 Tax=Ruminococcus flavefaciens TaxID=1265 RepID=A0A1M7HYB9_RUMFL|nr:hypothetical protein [Ruminococcus flavefaciens]SHM33494.1 hypothetical protein SAMN04487860_103174 [Ruminococcus flavefaciens]